MRISPNIVGLCSVFLALSCSSPSGSVESAPQATNPPSPSPQSAEAALNGGAGTDLDSAAPLTDQELDRLLDALEQQLDKK
jgi:hypothetical protein